LPGQNDSRQPHTTPSFLAPSARGLSQLRLGWNAPTASWRNELPAGSGDLRAFSTLQFRASVNFADARNPVGIAQDFTVTLEDGTGDFETAVVSDFSRALFYPPGEVGPVPKVILNAVRIPLSAFAGLDLADIRAIQFDFDQESQGALLLSDVAFSNAAASVAVDIRPGQCPNRVSARRRGNLPVVIAGTDDFDVGDIDLKSVRLAGVRPKGERTRFRDVATPFVPFLGKDDARDCTRERADGFEDLLMRFSQRRVVRALGPVSDGEVVVVPLTGALEDGTPIRGEDVIVIIGPRSRTASRSEAQVVSGSDE
jgi:hypothetical protein